MKAFAFALAIAAVAYAQDDETTDLIEDQEEIDQLYWERIEERNYYSRNLWLGVYQGLYGMGSHIERPTEQCFGDWIPEKMQHLSSFKKEVKENLLLIEYEEVRSSAYDVIDLMFLNDEYCHFRKAFWDLRNYCIYVEDACSSSTIMENVQKNTLSVITQTTSLASIFKEEKWEDMDEDSRGYALNQLGHSVASLFADLTGF